MPSGVYKRKLISEERKKELYSDEWRKKQSDSHKGQKPWNTGKKRPPFNESWLEKIKKNLTPNKGKPRPEISGEKNHAWRGGISFEPYTLDWTETLRRSIRERDRFSCRVCGEPQGDRLLDVHHIDYNKSNSSPDNLISLCKKCHMRTNHNRDYWVNYFGKI